MNYRDEVKRTANADLNAVNERFSVDPMLVNAAMGFAAEAAEACDLVKKHVFHGAPLDREKLIKEIGDANWYLELFMISLNTNTEEVQRLNVEKLRKRYPEGFSTQASIERKDVTGK